MILTHRFTRPALAAAVLVAGLGAAHAEGLYVGAALGTPDYHGRINGIGGDGGGVAGKLYGGYALTPNFAVEAGLFDGGHIDNATGKVDLRGEYIDAVGRYEFAPRWSLLGRAGVAEGRFTTSAGDDSSPALKVGIGVQYDLSSSLAVRAEYEHYRFTNAFDDKPEAGALSVGLQASF